MAEAAPVRRSPLAHRPPLKAEAGDVRLIERPHLEKHNLRGQAAALAPALASFVPLAARPLSSALGERAPGEGGRASLWLGPDEWLLLGFHGEDAAGLRERLGGTRHQLVRVSDAYTVVEVAGGRARDLLAKLTTLDLHPRAFGQGEVRGSMFGHAQAFLWLGREEADGPVFWLFVRASFADYLWCALSAAGREWGVPEAAPVSGEPMLLRTAQ